MTKEQYFQLKDELKALAKTISSDRYEFKNKQRKFSQAEKEYGTLDDAYSGNNDAKKKGINEAYNPMWKMQENLLNMKNDYRAKHIVYSVIRGRTLEQIEPNAKKDYWWYEVHRKMVPKYFKEYEVRIPLELISKFKRAS